MSDFLKNLKNAVENGEFNSEAAKKIIDIDKQADENNVVYDKSSDMMVSDKLNKMVESAGIKHAASEEEVEIINGEYDKQISKIKKQDAINQALANLINIEELVAADIDDMFSFVNQIDVVFGKEFTENDSMCDDLRKKVEEVKSKYSSIINKI